MISSRDAKRLVLKDSTQNYYVFGSRHPDRATSLLLDASVHLSPLEHSTLNPLCAHMPEVLTLVGGEGPDP